MYLSKQWRESRIISILAALCLALLMALVIKAGFAFNGFHLRDNDFGASVLFVPLFYIEAVLVAFWGWLIASIGAGKNLGEGSGSFLFTRPRSRAWFLWNDWGYAMGQIAVIIVLANLMIGLLCAHILHLTHRTAAASFTPEGKPLSLALDMIFISVGALLFAGLIYGLTYFCTIVLKRSIGVMLGAGILVAYLILTVVVHHYYPTILLPHLIISLFQIQSHELTFTGHLALKIAVRAAVMLAFPIAAQLILDRSEI
jgi:hypothetical protein